MQKTDNTQAAKSNHRKVQSSTTLNRKYTKRPVAATSTASSVQRSARISHFGERTLATGSMVGQRAGVQRQAISPASPHPIQESANSILRQRTINAQLASRRSAQELKNQAIQKALASAERVQSTEQKTKTSKRQSMSERMHFGAGRVVLALACATAAVFAIVYFVNLNMPDIPLQVAAMQTGIDPSYPKHIPRGYAITGITSEQGKITMEFKNSANGGSFSLIEERSSWDTNALVSNYVKKEYDENYSVVREQGLSIYISGSDAAWVNGGNVFKIKTTSGELTNKQIRLIATSL